MSEESYEDAALRETIKLHETINTLQLYCLKLAQSLEELEVAGLESVVAEMREAKSRASVRAPLELPSEVREIGDIRIEALIGYVIKMIELARLSKPFLEAYYSTNERVLALQKAVN